MALPLLSFATACACISSAFSLHLPSPSSFHRSHASSPSAYSRDLTRLSGWVEKDGDWEWEEDYNEASEGAEAQSLPALDDEESEPRTIYEGFTPPKLPSGSFRPKQVSEIFPLVLSLSLSIFLSFSPLSCSCSCSCSCSFVHALNVAPFCLVARAELLDRFKYHQPHH